MRAHEPQEEREQEKTDGDELAYSLQHIFSITHLIIEDTIIIINKRITNYK